MANQVVNRQVNVYINSGEAAKAYDKLIAKEKVLNAELAKTTDPKKIKTLGAELDRLKEPIDRAAKKMRGELAPSIRELELATRRFLNEFKKTGDPETLRKFQAFKQELDVAKQQLNGLDNANKTLTRGGIFSAAFWANLASNGIMKVTSLLGNFFGGAIQEALDADAATRRLSSTLDNLGRSDVFDRITRKADEMAAKFRYLDNDDIVAVFNKLIDYGKLTEAEMNNLLPVIIDFAAKSQVSLEESTSVIIKALEGNAKALKEYGIDIKDAGDETERLNIIMTTLKEKVDGAGEAFQNSAKGGIAVAKQELNNLKEDIGNEIIPALNKLLNFALNAIRGLKQFGSDLWATITGKGGGGVSQGDINNDVATNEFAEMLKGIEQLDTKAQIDKLKKYLDDRKYLVETYQKQIEDAKFDSTKTWDDINKLRAFQATNLLLVKMTEAQIKVLSDTKPLGISSGGGSSKNDDKEKPENKIDLLAQAFKRLAEAQKNGREAAKDWLKENEKALKQLMQVSTLEANDVDTAALDARVNNRRLAQNELNVLTSRGKKRLEAQLQLLNEQERQELKSKQWTEDEKLLIEEKYRQRRKAAETEYQVSLINNIINYAQQATQILSMFGDMQTQKENAELERDRQINEEKKRNLDRRLKAGTISQAQYNRELDKMEREQQKKEAEVKRKQFERQKRESIVNVLINGAQGISKTIAENGMPAAIPWIIAQGVIIAAQAAAIASQKAPQFAEGGKLGGRSHASGGNAVIDGQGRKIAEVEAGEAIVNKHTMSDRRRYSVSGTPSQIISRLNSMNGVSWDSGATLVPYWRSSNPQRMNFTAMKRMYAAGGLFNSQFRSNEAAENSVNENMTAMVSDMLMVQAKLAAVLENGITAYTVLTQQEKQQARLNAIRDDATMKP